MEILKKHFTDVGAKYLTKVDVGHQQEIGSNNFTAILGDPGEQKIPYDTTLIYIDDEVEEPIKVVGKMTWYDTRLAQTNRGPEFRLYYQKSIISERMREGDFCVVALKPDQSLLIVITPASSTTEQQLRWLFAIDDLPARGFSLKEVEGQRKICTAEAAILEELGIEIRRDDESWLGEILDSFGEAFPNTATFSLFARKTCPLKLSPVTDPDATLIAWIEHEEMLFRTLERKIVQRQLDVGFAGVDKFIQFSLSVQNRRKSRVGFALEHHLAEIFKVQNLRFGRQVVTEYRATADFLFPGQKEYLDKEFPSNKLFMLASKSTCKDRWRQVLAEAGRISTKHLFTLQPSISIHQTDEMKNHNLHLVVPRSLKGTYTAVQQQWLLDLESYIELVRRGASKGAS